MVNAQDDVTDSDDEPGIDPRNFTGFAACQNCGDLWVCDGRIEKPNHIHHMHVSRVFDFVCPSGVCT